ncbi:MAG: ATP-binding cassette domain-containing protein [Planctomycetes bacterium]|nr:ATP-binding cassette domain-containing protein [Planctomycetota bacterium]
MPVAVLNGITKAYPGRVVLDAVDFQVDAGQRVGLVGANGAGKTTLLRILAREIEADSGDIQIARGMRLGYVRQTDQLGGALTLEEALLEPFENLMKLHEQMEKVAHDMETASTPELLEKWGDLQHEYERGGGYEYEVELRAVSHGLGFEESALKKSVATMSGGERSRAALARELLAKPNLLLLDEPTNHIDIAGIEWLEDYLNDFPGAVVVVSHDRYFLDRVTNRTVEVERGKTEFYDGSYSNYVEEKEIRREAKRVAFAKQQDHIEKTEEYIRRFGAGQRARQAKGRKRRLERLERLDRPDGAGRSLRVRFGPVHRSALSAIKVRGVSKSFGQRELFKDVNFTIERGERVGLIGPNGSGKTTLFRIIVGQEKPDKGDAVLGTSVEVGYYDQNLGGLNLEKDVMDEIWGVDLSLTREQLQSWLALFLFPADEVHRVVGTLSGGEKSRVVLAKLLLTRPNTLFLDEPTNHLDIPSRTAIEEALDGYEGTIVTISHDRYFLDRICDRILAIEDGHVVDYPTDYTGMMEKREAKAGVRQPEKPAAPPPKPVAHEDHKEVRRRWKRIERIQEEITSSERKIEDLTTEQCAPEIALNRKKLMAIEKEKSELKAKCEALYAEWQTLEKQDKGEHPPAH